VGERIQSEERPPPLGRVPGLRVQYTQQSTLMERSSCLHGGEEELLLSNTQQPHLRVEEAEEWDNPFQPEGEVSQDAELILQLWRGGRLDTAADSLQENLKSLAAEAEREEEHSDKTDSEATGAGGDSAVQTNGVNGLHNGHKPVVNSQDLNYVVALSDKQKHKNKIKKHCNMM